MELLQLFFGSVLLLATGTAVILVCIGFFPGFTAQGAAVAERSSRWALLVGLINAFFFGTITLTLFALGQNITQIFSLPALLFLFGLTAGVVFGLPGLTALLGERLWPDKQPTVRHSYAAALLILAALMPFIGWFVLLPGLLIMALGVSLLALIGRLQQGRPATNDQRPATNDQRPTTSD
jgi:hypothetical protein